MPLLPDADELKAMKNALTAAGANLDVALPAAVVAFRDEAAWSAERAESWVTVTRAEHPEYWTKPPSEAEAARTAEIAALERAAFEGKGDAVARSKLVKLIGEQSAGDVARKFGLTGLGDFKTKGVAPAAADDKSGKGDDLSKDKPESNPWKLPPDDPVGVARRAEVIRSLGTKVAAGLAKSAGTDLAARPLRGRAA
jgi:hypothetical protein